MKTTMTVLGGLFLSLFGGSVYMAKKETPVATLCTEIMKVCPDGSNAVRVSNSCEFLPCKDRGTKTESEQLLTVHLNESVTIKGVTLTPVAIISDSRCPVNARCIKAGEIKVRISIVTDTKKEEAVLTLGVAHPFAGKSIILNHASQSLDVSRAILSSDYTFGFEVTDLQEGEARLYGELSGTMSIGPVCPVEIVDKPCTVSPETYASHRVYVQSTTEKRPAINLTPDAQGKFSTSLPAGTYTVDVDHSPIGSVMGAPQTIIIKKGALTTVSISIDTGMRLPTQTNNKRQ